MTDNDTMTITVEPGAALTMINEIEWGEEDMVTLRELSLAVEQDKERSWVVEDDN